MPNRVQWNSDYSVGNNMLDSQHKTILALCNTLADCLVEANPDGEMKFNDTFTTLMVTARVSTLPKSRHFSPGTAIPIWKNT
jgi:hemerythrin